VLSLGSVPELSLSHCTPLHILIRPLVLSPISLSLSLAHGDFVRVDTTVGKMEALLMGAKFQLFQHPLRALRGNKAPLVRSLRGFRLPAAVADHLDFVYGVTDFPTVRHGAGAQRSDQLMRLAASDRSRAAANSLSADDWFFSPVAGDSAISVGIAIPQGEDSNVGIEVTYSQGNYTRTTNFDTSRLKPEPVDKYAMYNVLVDHVANEALSVSVTLQYPGGVTSKQSYLSDLLPGPWITSQVVQQLYG
jgi:Pro-kumamolisin, activation domain